MRTILRGTTHALAAVAILAVLAFGDRYLAMRSSLPPIDGRLTVSGLSAPVDIVRDRYGIPHIFGETEEDVLFALGVAHAQDRLWQMEFTRRAAQGRLSEVLGSVTVDVDVLFRSFDFERYARESYRRLSAEHRRLIDAYAAGVNAVIADMSRPLPPEFLLLFHRPETWRPEDSLIAIKMMSVGLSTNMVGEIRRAQIIAALGSERAAEFYPPYPGDAPIRLPDLATLYRSLALNAPAWLPTDASQGASNAWAVDGRHTASGKPLLANDPHLELSIPSIWYLAHLSLPGGHIIGATIAGIPSIILGRNDRVAWGFTNTGADTQDLYVERLNPDNPREYLTPDGYAPFALREEVVKVRFGRDRRVTLRSTRHGPVLPGDWRGSGELLDRGHVLALQWTAFDGVDLTIAAGLDVMRAERVADVRAALRAFRVPMQNVVFADGDGTIGFMAAARVPIRRSDNDLMGLVPAPGWEARYDWTGFLRFKDLPQYLNPPDGIIVTANQKIVGDDYRHFITAEWEPPLRARRIADLIARRSSHDAETFAAIQKDEVSQLALDLLPLMLAAEPATTGGREALTRLRAWSGDMSAAVAEPLIFSAWFRELTRAVYADELGEHFPAHWSFRPLFIERVLTPGAPEARWCDDTTTAAAETCLEILSASLDRAVQSLARDRGEDMRTWLWGPAHAAQLVHAPFESFPFLRRFFSRRVPTGGGFYTINRGGHWFADAKPYANIHGSAYRAVYDLSSFDNSRFIQSTGQSGHPLSPFYDNFVEDWVRVAYVPMTVDRDKIEASAAGVLRLAPPSAAPD